ncbi:MAG: hypothetical protein JNJ39_00125 [Blastocatellia bacterium]|nr:hypothetical protein [Blastocatellia bacterium]
MTECTDSPPTVRQFCSCYFGWAKGWWWANLALKFAAFVLGVLAVFLPQEVVWLAGVVALLLFCGEVSGIRSGILRSTAESLHRKLDFQNSFEWPISDIELADAVATLSKRARKRLLKATKADDYFASTEPAGWKRAMQNLQESAWWSKHLAGSMANYCLALTIGLVSGSIAMLVISYLIVSSTEPLASVSRIAISVLLLIVSLGLIPLTINYRTFATRCRQSERRATDLLNSSGADSESQAIKAFNEYHLARASAPPLPSLLWKYMERHLNETWKQYMNRQ